MNELKLALPKGRLQRQTGELLQRTNLGLGGYVEGGRCYRLKSSQQPSLCAKVFQERDIPVQVAVGNYDLGICGRQWVEELMVKYTSSGLMRVMDLRYGGGSLYAAAGNFASVEELRRENGVLRLVSEYSNLAESLALKLRLRRFKILPVWGAAEAYPPENSDVAVLWRGSEKDVLADGLVPLDIMLTGEACLIANRDSWETRDMLEVLESLCNAVSPRSEEESLVTESCKTGAYKPASFRTNGKLVWLALPDGHQQVHTARFLSEAGIRVEGYSAKSAVRSPSIDIPGVMVKVIRPQDMPLQVANGNFDLAITGRDWLTDHLCHFPSSPAKEILDLEFGKVRLVAAISEGVPVEDTIQLRHWMEKGNLIPLRVASEYVNIADKFVRENHLAPYKVIPTWGATEAFLPEDADVLVENTETGRTLEEHNLRIFHTLAWSSACLIGNRDALISPERKETMESVMQAVRRGMGRR